MWELEWKPSEEAGGPVAAGEGEVEALGRRAMKGKQGERAEEEERAEGGADRRTLETGWEKARRNASSPRQWT